MESAFCLSQARNTLPPLEGVFSTARAPEYVFSFWKTYSSHIHTPPHRFGDIFATVNPNEAILVALVSYRAPLRVGIGCMPWSSIVICWSSQRELTPLVPPCFVRLFCREFVGTQDQGCVSPLIGEGKPRHPSHLRKALTRFIYCCLCYACP